MGSITMTDAAINHVQQYLDNRGHGSGIRLGVKTNGCSGMAYVIEFVDGGPYGEDLVVNIAGFKLVVDQKSLVYLDGTELDFTKEGLNEGFKFNNPNEAGSCGCGESFTI